jgi:hypothetical protein
VTSTNLAGVEIAYDGPNRQVGFDRDALLPRIQALDPIVSVSPSP